MTKTKQSSIDSKNYFDEHRETTRSELGKIKSKDDLSDKQKNALIKLLLDDVKEKQSTDEFRKHAEVRKADYKKIRELVIERVGDPKTVTKEDIQNAVDFFYGKTEKKESKETMEKPQLESENYKIDKGLTKKEKLDQGWKEEERLAYINGIETNIKVLKKELTEGAFVREYQDDGKIPKHLVGEQLFNKVAVTYLDLWKKLPTRENMVVMRGKTKEERENFLKNNFQKDGKNLFPGFWDPDDKGFYGIGKRTGYGLSDGSIVGINKDNMHHYNGNPEFGFSLRFLKN
ncbi:MAG TPA: hypothetical protein P5155_02115 [Candidatus Absconditabacterales bacterium]|nr:hypothetical protein [Candidatus Absconditabacterales bacterium]